MKILIVDDESIGRDSLKAVLTSCSHQVATASQATDALEIADEFGPDVAIIDLHLGPPLNGIGVAEALRERFPSLRIVIVSGQSEARLDQLETLEAGFLGKPFQLDELLRLIGACA